ncbi:MAG: tetratricopeptide repeat protein [Acidobacteriota bacterium]|nr:tetratricopeptide repeat protein [Acidobacteriota bacterium]
MITRICLLILWLGAAVSVAAAQPPSASGSAAGLSSVQQRLMKVGSDLYAGASRPDAAIKELKAILAIDPGLADAHMYLGMAYRMTGSEDLMGEARAELIQALALAPDLVPARFILAQLYLDLRRPAGARETLTAGLAQHPGQPQLMALLGEAERQLGNPGRAVDLARQVLVKEESFTQARYYLALALLDGGQREEATTELERVVRSGPKVADAYLALGTAYLDAGRVDAAVEALREATTVDGSRPDTRIALARAYRSKGLLARADAELTLARPRAIASAASPLSQRQVEPDFYLELGLVRLRQGRLTAAAAAFEKVLETEPDHQAATRHLAEVRKLREASRGKQKE